MEKEICQKGHTDGTLAVLRSYVKIRRDTRKETCPQKKTCDVTFGRRGIGSRRRIRRRHEAFRPQTKVTGQT